jgi:thiol-disulfide isomerase/thioredoxin
MRILSILLMATFFLSCNGISAGRADKKEKMALGYVTAETLLKEYPKFRKSYDQYRPDSTIVEKLKAWDKDVDVLTVLGTWCSDSRWQVGRFLKVMDLAGNEHFKLKFFGVDRTKKDKEGLTEKLGIKRVPTFIIYYQEKEVGRIVERPKKRFIEKDFWEILEKIK